jgi:hypothetical protein
MTANVDLISKRLKLLSQRCVLHFGRPTMPSNIIAGRIVKDVSG